MAKRALIYGIIGQDGQYLSRLLLEKGYSVAGTSRNEGSLPGVEKIYSADLAGETEHFLFPLNDFSPDEVYNLAGISSPRVADANPVAALKVNSQAPIAMLGAIAKLGNKARFFQASSAYMFSGQQRVNEASQPSPAGEYGRSKLQAHLAVAECRKKGAFACSGILFNHESPLRSPDFVTRKISLAAAEFALGKRQGLLSLGSLDARRDWGFAGDYVEAMWLMLQQEKPGDYVIATGEQHSVRDFCKEAFSHAGLDYEKCIVSDPGLMRRPETGVSADIHRAREALGWKPKTSFKQLVHMMVDEDIRILRDGGIS